MKNLLSSIILTIGMLSCASCTDLMKDDGSRGFANVATIVGDAENGFYCYQRHYAGLVVSHSKELAGKERGYFNFYYTEDDWTTSTNGMKYIDIPSPRRKRMPDTSPAMKIVLFPNHCL